MKGRKKEIKRRKESDSYDIPTVKAVRTASQYGHIT